ncbi:MAG: hypothetical protein IJX15_07560 [Ruminiclostridium sp.]|nr:hypothetical protein [Ruminiclostridium sp.]MBQ8842730.1 hypothetical protein [Ruminiclostridium sp.]
MNIKTGKPLLFYSIAAIIIASVIRFFQYVSIIDFRTGFFTYGSETAGALIYIVLLAAAAGFAGLTVFGLKKSWTALTVSSDGMGSKATIILGASFLGSAISKFIYSIGLDTDAGDGFFEIVSSYAFAIALAALGLMLLKSSVPPFVTGIIMLISALYFFGSAVSLFTEDLVIKNHSDNLILLFIYILGTLFFVASARFYSRIETKLSRTREVITGGFAFIVSGMYVVSKLIALAFGGDAVKGMSGINADAVIVLLISGAFIITLCTTEQKSEINYLLPEKDDEEAEKEEKEE